MGEAKWNSNACGAVCACVCFLCVACGVRSTWPGVQTVIREFNIENNQKYL